MRARVLLASVLAVAGCGAQPKVPDMQAPMPDLLTLFDFAHGGAVDLAAVDNAAPPADLAVPDAAVPPDAAAPVDIASTDLASTDLAVAAGDMTALTYLGQTFAYYTNGSGQISLGVTASNSSTVASGTQGTATAGQSVTVTTQTYPQGAASSVHLVYQADDPTVSAGTDVTMTFDHTVGNNDQWYGVIPGQASGATIYFFVYATSSGGTLYDPSGFGVHLTYKVQ
jgi:hypothetical protein